MIREADAYQTNVKFSGSSADRSGVAFNDFSTDIYNMNREASLPISKTGPATQSVVLVVDDNEFNRDLLMKRLSRDGHRVVQADNGERALAILRDVAVDLVLLDIRMPVMDGYQVLAEMKAEPALQHIPVIIITAVDETEGAIRCIEQGAEDYIGKPFDPVLLKARVCASLAKKRFHDAQQRHKEEIEGYNRTLEQRVQSQVREISHAQLAAIFAMSKLAESKDPETGEHLERMREYCLVLSQELAGVPRYRDLITQSFIDNVYAASPLHDIGKVGIPDNVLLKPGRLTDQEWMIMKQHPGIGGATLRAVDRQYPGNAFVRTGIEIAECHHEKWDGSGYPAGLRGEEIPLSARILALGDVYDALTSRRCYKQKFSHDKSRSIIIEQSGSHFDPDVVEAFLTREDEFIRIRREFQDNDQDQGVP
jgi:putative two-component system response regulator